MKCYSFTCGIIYDGIDVEMLSDTERDVLRVIADSSASSSGSLVEKAGLDAAQLSGVLLRLEQLGYVRRNAGNQFELVLESERRARALAN